MFHPRTDDRWWTETWWNAWFVPEKKMIGYFYPVFRPNIGVQFGGVVVYDDRGDVEWEVPVFDYDWHQEIPEGLDLRDAELANGMTIKCLEPARRYELGYKSRDLELHLEVEGVIKPLVTNGTPPFNKGHIDQICRFTGEMVLEGETIPVDCLAMRDRSWGPRQDGRQPTVGYNYAAADAENAFLAVSQCKATDVWNVTTGFLLREGVWSEVHEGRRSVVRDDEGHPVVGRDRRDRRSRPHLRGRGHRGEQQRVQDLSRRCCAGTASWTGAATAGRAGARTRTAGCPAAGATTGPRSKA